MAQDTEDKVVPISGEGVIIENCDVHEGLVKELEELLERAKSGEIVGLTGALLHHDKSTSYRLAGLGSRALVGALAVAQHELIEDTG